MMFSLDGHTEDNKLIMMNDNGDLENAVGNHPRNGYTEDDNDDDDMASLASNTSLKVGVIRCCKATNSLTVAILILLLGCAASAAFLSIGILNALRDSQRAFENDVQQLAVRVHNSFREYETAALWVHQFSYSHKLDVEEQPNATQRYYAPNFRSLFRDLYESVVAKGLPLHAIQYIPNVTRDQRDWYEQEARQFYQEYYPGVAVQYEGFSGFVPDGEGGVKLEARAPDDFYFPVHFVEPVLDNVGVLDFDVYSEDYPRWAVNTALESRQPVITGRLRLIQEPDPSPHAFSVLMMHPGAVTSKPYGGNRRNSSSNITEATDGGGGVSGDISLVAIRIPSLLHYMARKEHIYDKAGDHMPDMDVYLYDSTPSDPTLAEPLYLGGAKIEHCNGEGNPEEFTIEYLPTLSLTELASQTGQPFHTTLLEIGMRQWSLACVAGPGTYPPTLTFAMVGGVMILIAFMCLSLWVYTHMNKTAQTNRLKARAREEKALLRIDHARQAHMAERQLNEFLSHEIRNPLSAAMSACTFVSSAIQELNAATSSSVLFSSADTEDAQQQHSQSNSTAAPPPPLFALPPKQPAPSSPLVGISPASSRPTISFPASASDIEEEAVASEAKVPPPPPLFALETHDKEGTKAGPDVPAAPPLFSLMSSTSEAPAMMNQIPTASTKEAETMTSNDDGKGSQGCPASPPRVLGNTQSSSADASHGTKQEKHIIQQQQQKRQHQQQQDNNSRSEAREEIMADLHIIDSSLTFINDLLRNMLDVQRAACHQLKIEKSTTDILRDILEPVDAMLYRRGRNNVQVIIDCPDDNLLVETDRLRLKQVVLNLARNASKFVERGWIRLKVVVVTTTTTKSTSSTPQQQQQSTSSEAAPSDFKATTNSSNGRSVQIWVEDTGVGIPNDKKKRLFAKFQESLDSLSQGTGLGLSLCQILVHLMGGAIWLDESYRSGFDDRPGSRFIIDLKTPPLAVDDDEEEPHEEYHDDHNIEAPVVFTKKLGEQQASMETAVSRGNSDTTGDTTTVRDSGSSMMGDSSANCGTRKESSPLVEEDPPQELPSSLSVLFVDDDTVLRKLLVRAVRKITPGWSIQEAASGEAALRLVDDNTFDLIFMDQYMASMQKQLLGTETTHALRSKGVRSKICGLSANDMAVDFFSAGADAFVCKPLPTKKDSLHQILCEILLENPFSEPFSTLRRSSLVVTPANCEEGLSCFF